MPSRQLIVHSAFTAVFVAIAVFAVWTANGTTAPWFSAAVSSQAYAASLVGAVVVAIALATAALTAARTRKELLKALLVERARVEVARTAAAPSVAGPIAIALVFAFAAGAMLPGSDGFAASQFQLNTALLLFLGYGWMFLVFWAVLALSMLTAR